VRIVRFDLSARVLHWSHAIFFLWLLITGIHLFLTPKSLLGDPLIKMVHIYASVPFIIIPASSYISGSRNMHNDINKLMSFKKDDMKWLFHLFNNTYINSKFNPGQKANFVVTLLMIFGLSLSGFVVWMKSLFSVGFVELIFIVHDFLAEFSLLLICGHIILALYHRESIRGIVNGDVDEDWSKEHYSED
jgi:formate dehydrogenase gamma subunit